MVMARAGSPVFFKRAAQRRQRVRADFRRHFGLDGVKLLARVEGQLHAPLGHDHQFLIPARRIVLKPDKSQRVKFTQGFRDRLPGNLHALGDLRGVGGPAIEISEQYQVRLGDRIVSARAQTQLQAPQNRLRRRPACESVARHGSRWGW